MTVVAVIGAGLLGRGIASVLVDQSFPVMLHDASATVLAGAHEALSQRAPAGAVRQVATLEEAVEDADFVIEAVLENLSLKQQLFARMGEVNARAILMSNSSVLPIGQIAMNTRNPERTVGTHWWNPPDLIPVVEVIRGPNTGEETMIRAAEFLTRLGKRPVRVARDVPGFVGNRLQHALWREAIGMVSQGSCDPVTVDRLVSATLGVALARRGPIAQMNRIGLARVTGEFEAVLPTLVNEQTPARMLRKKVHAGELGAKSGQGFLTWAPGGREHCAERLQRHVEARIRAAAPDARSESVVARQLSLNDQTQAARLRVAFWREAIALISDGVCDAATVDVMACNTLGLRLAVMGPVENADYVGLDLTLAIHEAVLPSLSASTAVSPLLLAKVRASASF